MKEYVPEFPFGRNIYDVSNNNLSSNIYNFKKHHKPDQDDLQMIYKFLHFDIGKNVSGKNKFQRIFTCYTKDKKPYISYKPCNVSY